MYVIMDMGTTNTRLYMWANNQVVDHVKGNFGASFGKKNGRLELCKRVGSLLNDLLDQCAVKECDMESIVALGMAGSEIGLLDIPHIFLPADARTLAENIRKEKIEGINIPFLFVPGVKKTEGNVLIDVMRGEETETIGLASILPFAENAIFVLPGTHNKIVQVSSDGTIDDFHTTFSGELLDSIISNTILAEQVAHDFQIVESAVLKGALYAKENGLLGGRPQKKEGSSEKGVQESEEPVKDTEREAEVKTEAVEVSEEVAGQFEEFFAEYPKKTDREAAISEYARLSPDAELHRRIMVELRSSKTYPNWLKENGRYVPRAAVWLSRREWEMSPKEKEKYRNSSPFSFETEDFFEAALGRADRLT